MASAATSTLDEMLKAFRLAPSASEKGTKFENLMVDFFRQDPSFPSHYDTVRPGEAGPVQAHGRGSGGTAGLSRVR